MCSSRGCGERSSRANSRIAPFAFVITVLVAASILGIVAAILSFLHHVVLIYPHQSTSKYVCNLSLTINKELSDGVLMSPSFELPAAKDFDGFLKEVVQMVKPAKGTNTLAFIFKGGVLVTADSRGRIYFSVIKAAQTHDPDGLATVFHSEDFE